MGGGIGSANIRIEIETGMNVKGEIGGASTGIEIDTVTGCIGEGGLDIGTSGGW